MLELKIKRHMTPDDIAELTPLLTGAERADGQRPLDDHLWVDLVEGGRAGFAGLVASHPGDTPIAYAQLSPTNASSELGASWEMGLVVDPRHREELTSIAPQLLLAAVGIAAEAGGGHVHWWVAEPTPEHEAVAREAGFTSGRALHQMRRPLPLEETSTVASRPFRVGEDEEAWLAVNNRAFAAHPEQGGWDVATIRARETKPWFDPEGFLLHERDGRLAAFCWTKVHEDHDPVLGEIYVIGVDPDFQGLGLGRAMTVAGLAHLSKRGAPVGMLYVEAANQAGMHLYGALGFKVWQTKRAFTADIAGATRGTG